MKIIKKNYRKSCNVICIKWGDKYNSSDVNLLYKMILSNVNEHDVRFYCFTDEGRDLIDGIIVKPLPVLNVAPEDNKYSYRKEVGLCDDDIGGLRGERVFYFDLDVIITEELDSLLAYPEQDEFVIINDWATKGSHVGQASCYSWVVGTVGFIKEDFEKNPQKWIQKFYTASQEYLSYKIIERDGKLNFWPSEWFASFKFNCLPPLLLRPFMEPKLPAKTKVLVFHGNPKLSDAIQGKWGGNVPIWKKIYKTIRPSPWLSKYIKL